jgi:hypothetical protein
LQQPVRLIAFITEAPAVKTILGHLGEPTTPPELARARAPPALDQTAEPLGHGDDSAALVPEFVFDQPLGW